LSAIVAAIRSPPFCAQCSIGTSMGVNGCVMPERVYAALSDIVLKNQMSLRALVHDTAQALSKLVTLVVTQLQIVAA